MSGTALIIATARRLGATPMEDTKTHEYRMEIRSSSSTRNYVVSRRKGDHQRWECSCMGWIRHRHCKHLDAVVPSLETALAGASASTRVTPRIVADPAPAPQPARPEPRPETPWSADSAMQAMWAEMGTRAIENATNRQMMAFLTRHLQAAFDAGRRSK